MGTKRLISRVIATGDVTSRLIDFVTETLLLVPLVLRGSLVLLVGFPVLLAPKSPAIGTTCGNPGVRDWNESEERADGRA